MLNFLLQLDYTVPKRLYQTPALAFHDIHNDLRLNTVHTVQSEILGWVSEQNIT